MPTKFMIVSAALLAGFAASPALHAQANELSVLAGAAHPSASVSVASIVSVSGGYTASVQADFAHRLKDGANGALYFELPAARVFHASVDVGLDHVSASQSQLFFTPGMRYVFAPRARVSPYAAGGFGFGWYDAASLTVIGPASVRVLDGYHPAAGVGAGAEVRITRGLVFRAEVRDFINCAAGVGSRNHMVYNGGFGVRF